MNQVGDLAGGEAFQAKNAACRHAAIQLPRCNWRRRQKRTSAVPRRLLEPSPCGFFSPPSAPSERPVLPPFLQTVHIQPQTPANRIQTAPLRHRRPPQFFGQSRPRSMLPGKLFKSLSQLLHIVISAAVGFSRHCLRPACLPLTLSTFDAFSHAWLPKAHNQCCDPAAAPAGWMTSMRGSAPFSPEAWRAPVERGSSTSSVLLIRFFVNAQIARKAHDLVCETCVVQS
jgi:hypothetical protein